MHSKQDKKSAVMNRPKKVRPKSNDWDVGFFTAKYSYKFNKKSSTRIFSRLHKNSVAVL